MGNVIGIGDKILPNRAVIARMQGKRAKPLEIRIGTERQKLRESMVRFEL